MSSFTNWVPLTSTNSGGFCEPTLRGRGTQLKCREQFWTTASFVPARLLLERLGFRQEGLLREHARLAGEWVDVVWYGLLADQHKPAIGLSTT
jgi:hypothetical protein